MDLALIRVVDPHDSGLFPTDSRVTFNLCTAFFKLAKEYNCNTPILPCMTIKSNSSPIIVEFGPRRPFNFSRIAMAPKTDPVSKAAGNG